MYMLTINRGVSVSKTSVLGGSIDTYLQLASIDSINTWYWYRAHPYLLYVCEKLMAS